MTNQEPEDYDHRFLNRSFNSTNTPLPPPGKLTSVNFLSGMETQQHSAHNQDDLSQIENGNDNWLGLQKKYEEIDIDQISEMDNESQKGVVEKVIVSTTSVVDDISKVEHQVREQPELSSQNSIIVASLSQNGQCQNPLNLNNNKNGTKNISKNFGKAIIGFALKNRALIEILIKKNNLDMDLYEIIHYLRIKKKELTSISKLKQLWLENEYAVLLRTISIHFLRKRSLGYIFNDSRMKNKNSHIKYRSIIMEAVQNPIGFRKIKF